MLKRSGYFSIWIALLLVAVAAGAMVIIPVWLIQPFAPQTPRGLDVSFLLRRWSPLATFALLVIGFILAAIIWANARRWFGRAVVIFPVALIVLFAWFARQNHFEWMFNPLGQTAYVASDSADFVRDDDMVLAVTINGESAAYPVRQMAYHHVVQDVVGGMPITASY